MKITTFGVIAVVMTIAVIGLVNLDDGAAGGVVVNGPVCCTVTPYTQASYGIAQYGTITETVMCDNTQPRLCCSSKLSSMLRLPVVVNGAVVGACGAQGPELNLPYVIPY